MRERTPGEILLLKTLFAGAGLWLLYANLSFVLDALIALMLAAAMLPLVERGRRLRVPRAVTVLAVYLVGIAGLVLLISLLVPVVADQGRLLMANLPAYRERLAGYLTAASQYVGRHIGPGVIEIPDFGLREAGPLLQQLAERSLQATRGVFTGALSLLLILFVAAYFVIDGPHLVRGLLRFVPKARRDEAARIGAIVIERMGGYVLGQIAVSAALALLLSIGLTILGLDTPVLIGVTAGALNFVPFLGSTIALLLALLVAVNAGTFSVIGVLVLFGSVQALEGKLLVPYLLGRKVALHPLAVLAAILVGAHLAGLVGAVVAVPILAGLNAILEETYVKRLDR